MNKFKKQLLQYIKGINVALKYAYPIGAAENAHQWNNKFNLKPNLTHEELPLGKHHIRL